MEASKYTLRSLSEDVETVSSKAEEHKEEQCGYVNRYGRNVWLWLVVVFIIVLVILWLLSPNFVMSEDECSRCLVLDWGKLVIWSIVISLFIVLLFWLFYACNGSCNEKSV